LPAPVTATFTWSACAAVMLELVGTTVTVGVILEGGGVPPPDPPLHAMASPAKTAIRTTLTLLSQLRRRTGMKKKTRQAMTAPPAPIHLLEGCGGSASAPVVGAVVEIVSVAVPALALEITTGLVEPKLSVGRSFAPVGLAVICAVKATEPVNPPVGVTVIFDVFAEVAPGSSVTLAAERLKPEATLVETVTVLVPVDFA
jgi:hypothetical protein